MVTPDVSSEPMSHQISLKGNSLRFSAAHFATFEGQCEPLHGHNYSVSVDIEGELTEDSWVFDFTEAKHLIADICKELDHRFILQLRSASLNTLERDSEYEITFEDRRYVIPKVDIAALEIDNSTAERLAEWLSGRILIELKQRGATNITRLSVGVEEAPGQSGWYEQIVRA